MRLRPRRRSLLPDYPAARYGNQSVARPARPQRMRRSLRTGALVAAIALIRLTRAVRLRWLLLLAGTVLTAAGVVLRDGWGMVAIAGPWLVVYALFVPACPGPDAKRRDELEHELAAYSTLADRRDLEATLDRYATDVTHELRDILAGQAMAACSRQ